MSRRIVIDGRNVLTGERLSADGFTYSSFGRGTVVPETAGEGAAASSRVASLQWGRG